MVNVSSPVCTGVDCFTFYLTAVSGFHALTVMADLYVMASVLLRGLPLLPPGRVWFKSVGYLPESHPAVIGRGGGITAKGGGGSIKPKPKQMRRQGSEDEGQVGCSRKRRRKRVRKEERRKGGKKMVRKGLKGGNTGGNRKSMRQPERERQRDRARELHAIKITSSIPQFGYVIFVAQLTGARSMHILHFNTKRCL